MSGSGPSDRIVSGSTVAPVGSNMERVGTGPARPGPKQRRDRNNFDHDTDSWKPAPFRGASFCDFLWHFDSDLPHPIALRYLENIRRNALAATQGEADHDRVFLEGNPRYGRVMPKAGEILGISAESAIAPVRSDDRRTADQIRLFSTARLILGTLGSDWRASSSANPARRSSRCRPSCAGTPSSSTSPPRAARSGTRSLPMTRTRRTPSAATDHSGSIPRPFARRCHVLRPDMAPRLASERGRHGTGPDPQRDLSRPQVTRCASAGWPLPAPATM